MSDNFHITYRDLSPEEARKTIERYQKLHGRAMTQTGRNLIKRNIDCLTKSISNKENTNV